MRLALPGLTSIIEKNATVVVPSRLLASTAEIQIARDHLARGEQSWERPAILSLNAWLTQCWAKARYRSLEIPALLSSAQEHLLWKRLIVEDGLRVFDLNASARLAARAALTVRQWDIDLTSELWKHSGDARHFRRWHDRLLEVCRRERWMTRADVWRELPQWIARGYCEAESVVFVLNDPAPPALHQVCIALGRGASLKHFATQPSKEKSRGKCFESWEEEIDFAARWARARLELEPGLDIGVVVPGLAQHRALVQRSFDKMFYPRPSPYAMGAHTRANSASAFHVNSARPADAEPLIAGALLLLQIARNRISIGDAGAVLRSPWISGAAAERDSRARADFELRRRRELDVDLEAIRAAASFSPQLSRALSAVRALLSERAPSLSFSGWSRFFGAVLTALGWPGSLELSADEQASVETWKESLSQLSSLALVADAVPLEVAVSELRTILRNAATKPNLLAPVQIVDAGEVRGLQFDAALLTGLSEKTWPSPLYPSPFVPLQLQREHALPEGSPDAARARNENLTQALFSLAPDCAATWSGELSPMAERYLKKRTQAIDHWPGPTAMQAFGPVILDELDDHRAPVYQPGEGPARGGTSIIRAQSACPFQAFAEFRLNARAPEESCLGLDARERGGYLHEALKFVWKEFVSRDTLRAASEAEREKIVSQAVAQAMARERLSPFSEIAASVEAERLQMVILEWLQVEASRQYPFEVTLVEEEQRFALGGLPLRLRVDRIDRLHNGKVVLIDYKSGEQTRNKLNGERPREPQLLVYAAAANQEVDGVLFAQLTPRNTKPVGFTREKQFARASAVSALGPAWPAFLADSQSTVTRLAQDFLAGQAAVDPAPQACNYCAHKPICRVRESDVKDTEEE